MKIIRLVPILLTGVHRHKFVDNGAGSHTCSVCGGVFAHTFVVSPSGDRCRVCSGCGATTGHSWQNGACTVCGQGHSPHSWAQRSDAHYCTVCGAAVAHSWQNGACTVCGQGHSPHNWAQRSDAHYCTICGAAVAHSWQNGVCAVCGYACTHPSCEQHELSHQCNVCGIVEEHNYVFVYDPMVCKRCTVCGKEIVHEGIFESISSYYKCPVCGYTTGSRPQN